MQPTVYTSYSSDELVYNHIRFKKEAPAQISEHTHDFIEVILLVTGDVYHVVEGRRYRLGASDLVLVKPTSYHYIEQTGGDYERYDLLFRASVLEGIDVSEIFSRIETVHCPEGGIIASLFPKLDHYFHTFSGEDFARMARLLICELFMNLSKDRSLHSIATEGGSELLNRALSYINEHLLTISDLSEICKALYITESYLFSVFKRELHTSPKRYITEKRLFAANAAIAAGTKPTEVYRMTGFGDYSAFYRSYTRFFGHPPSKR